MGKKTNKESILDDLAKKIGEFIVSYVHKNKVFEVIENENTDEKINDVIKILESENPALASGLKAWRDTRMTGKHAISLPEHTTSVGNFFRANGGLDDNIGCGSGLSQHIVNENAGCGGGSSSRIVTDITGCGSGNFSHYYGGC